ncbi:MAG: LPS export ABC transporter periplasmic protein LptC [Candidatus Eisenbacteria bacterium]|nr:LPS export ABC transporter periplasmic protein LptC [Candidatus Eisenbacteria bacterium]
MKTRNRGHSLRAPANSGILAPVVSRPNRVSGGLVPVRVSRIVFVLCAVTLLVLGGCRSQSPPGEEEGGVVPDQEIDAFSLTQTREGTPIWRLDADRALVFEDAGRIEMTGVRAVFFEKDGSVRSTLRAREGVLHERTNSMEATGDVVVTAEDETVLETEYATWSERTGTIETDRFVRVTRGDDVMTGTGLTADPDLRNIKVHSDFEAYIRTPEGELVEEE